MHSWLNRLLLGLVKNSLITTKHLYLILTFRSHHDIFIRRSWNSVLPSLDATISCRIKKAVVGVTQLVTTFVSIHSSMTFLADMHSFLDPPGGMVLFSVDDRSLFPVECRLQVLGVLVSQVPTGALLLKDPLKALPWDLLCPPTPSGLD